jgi:hypothetical protein
MQHPHITNINIFDATKVVVSEQDTTKDKHGGSHHVKITIHGDDGATTEITVWRESGTADEAPELIVKQLPRHPVELGELIGENMSEKDVKSNE